MIIVPKNKQSLSKNCNNCNSIIYFDMNEVKTCYANYRYYSYSTNNLFLLSYFKCPGCGEIIIIRKEPAEASKVDQNKLITISHMSDYPDEIARIEKIESDYLIASLPKNINVLEPISLSTPVRGKRVYIHPIDDHRGSGAGMNC